MISPLIAPLELVFHRHGLKQVYQVTSEIKSIRNKIFKCFTPYTDPQFLHVSRILYTTRCIRKHRRQSAIPLIAMFGFYFIIKFILF